MSAGTVLSSGLVLMFILGLRHGLDPDHIACIDGLTWRALAHGHRHAGWVGTLFALGHGLVVTVIAVIVGKVAPDLHVPARLIQVLEWIPTALLLLVGCTNLRLLRAGTDGYTPRGWTMGLLPRALRARTGAWAVMATGVLFASVFDTATQAAAWGYVASHQGGSAAALAAGLAFTAGMVTTDTLDGRLVCHIGRGAVGPGMALRLRRVLGWLIVAMSFGVALYNIVKALVPRAELDEAAFSWTGFGLVAAMALLWAGLGLSRRGTPPCRRMAADTQPAHPSPQGCEAHPHPR